MSTAASTVANEGSALITAETATTAAIVGAGFVNASHERISNARADGPLTFRVLGLLGGIAMIISNALAILDRFFSFHLAGAMLAIYGVIFGIIIVMLDAPGPCGRSLQSTIRTYVKFLEFTWGRGMLYVFVGTLQITSFNMLDWAVGGFMIFVGATAILAGIAAARNMYAFRLSIKNAEDLKNKWTLFDANRNGTLDVKELTAFIHDSNVNMSRNEVAAVFLSLDKDFNEEISFQEFYDWWSAQGNPKSRSLIV